jgi:hypothetical protein
MGLLELHRDERPDAYVSNLSAADICILCAHAFQPCGSSENGRHPSRITTKAGEFVRIHVVECTGHGISDDTTLFAAIQGQGKAEGPSTVCTTATTFASSITVKFSRVRP